MTRWIAFDQKTVERLRERLPRGLVFEHGARNVADYVTGGPETLVTVLPLDPGEAAVAVFRQRTAQPKVAVAGARPFAASAAAVPSSRPPIPFRRPDEIRGKAEKVRPGGFLGLRDEAVFEEEKRPQQKKTWWQRFWDEDE